MNTHSLVLKEINIILDGSDFSIDGKSFDCYEDTLFQSYFWALFQARRGKDPRFFLCTFLNSSFLLLLYLRRGPAGHRYAYVPKGPNMPVDETLRGIFLENLAEALRSFLPLDLVCIRFDTIFDSPYTDEQYWTSTGQWKGAPRDSIRELRMNFGTQKRNLRKTVKDHFSTDTVIIDLKSSEQELLGRMRQTTRNSIRRAYKSELEFVFGGEELLDDWYDLYKDTAERKGLYFEKIGYFELLLNEAKTFESFIGKDLRGESPKFILVMAKKNGLCLAGAIVASYKKSGFYLYAGSSLMHRECMANYGLQMEIIRWLKGQGCTHYDLMGVPPNGDPAHSMYGLYTFKTGLGGKIVHYTGCWDYPYCSVEYESLRNSENIWL